MFNTRRRQNLKRMERIISRKQVAQGKKVSEVSLRRKQQEDKGIIYWLLKPLPDFKSLGFMLERAGKDVSAKRYVFSRFLWFAIIAGGVFFATKHIIISLFVGLVIGVLIPFKILKRKINKRNQAFLKVFPDAIDLIVRGLRSGLPVAESLNVVSTEVPDPVGSTFTDIANTMKLGVTMDKALAETGKKLRLTEFNFFTTSIVLQRETGGNLSEILNNLSEVLRSRFIMKMKIKAMTSEARASAMIIGALPFVVIGAMLFVSPSYMLPLIEDESGNKAAAIAAGMLFTGVWSMNRMAKFEI